MREIKFRGKRVEDYEWVYGDFSRIVTPSRIIYAISISACLYEIDLDTVGQFTGLEDKNGNNIYEGDIIKIITADTEEERFACVKFGKFKDLCTDDSCLGFYFESEGIQFPIFSGESDGYDLPSMAEVIGNIYDNPELLNENYEETEDEVNDD